MATYYARLVNQFIFKNQTVFSARFDKHDEDGLMIVHFKLFFTFSINQKVTETDINNNPHYFINYYPKHKCCYIMYQSFLNFYCYFNHKRIRIKIEDKIYLITRLN